MQRKIAVLTRCEWWNICKYFYIKKLISQEYLIIWVKRKPVKSRIKKEYF
jgi:hypothetical protein